ncbi:MAG: class I SAM-dependent methyltransferase [Acidimicrobiales bacterium]
MDADPGLYGRSFADVYDEWYADVSDVNTTVSRLSRLADGGPILELGSGTGRLAHPLRAAGADVVALDVSPEMNRRLAAKNGGDDRCPLVEADMSVLPMRTRSFAVVFIAYNTICNLTAPQAQRRCLAEAARVIEPGGHLAVEVLIPPDPALTPDQGTSLRSDDGDVTVLTSTRRGDDAHHVIGRHIEIHTDGRRRIRPWELRWVSPTELDQLAARAGLALVERSADWAGTPFGPRADAHVSIYQPAFG